MLAIEWSQGIFLSGLMPQRLTERWAVFVYREAKLPVWNIGLIFIYVNNCTFLVLVIA
jgi:hypothetical protein